MGKKYLSFPTFSKILFIPISGQAVRALLHLVPMNKSVSHLGFIQGVLVRMKIISPVDEEGMQHKVDPSCKFIQWTVRIVNLFGIAFWMIKFLTF